MGKTTLNLTAGELNTAATRLFERADTITQITLTDLVSDLRLAGQACERLAAVRAELSEIAAKCRDHDAARELRDMLDDAERS
jgi:hypothetical protein